MAYESKRFTPKKSGSVGGPSAGAGASSSTNGGSATPGAHPTSSGRYTPRTTPSSTAAVQSAESPAWVAWLMFAFFGLGLLIIVINYTNIWWDASNWALIGGLVAIILGFITATRLR